MDSKIHSQLMELLQHPRLQMDSAQECLSGLKTEYPSHDVYRDFFYLLTHVELSENKARQHWTALGEHHQTLQSKLGSELDIRVSALNYFIQVVELENPKIMEMRVYLKDQTRIVRDDLTGLFNYRHFRETLPLELKRAHGASTTMAVVLIDLDDFKKVNDDHGHLIGDRVLKGLGKLILQQVGSSGMCFRYGGEELAVILPGADKKQAFLFAENLRGKIESHHTVYESRSDGKGANLKITASLGVSCFPFDSEEAETLVHQADKALYAAKGSGKNQVAMFSENLRRHQRYEIGLDGKLSVLSQPTISLKIVDISQSGIGFTSDGRFNENDVVALDIQFDSRSSALRLVGRIVYINPAKSPTLYGAEFIGMTDESQLTIQNLIRSLR